MVRLLAVLWLLCPALASACLTIDSAQITIDSTITIGQGSSNFGSVTIAGVNQSLAGAVTPKPVFLAGSAASFQTTYFDTGNLPFVPQAVQYRIDDLLSGEEILAPTSVTPANGNRITITSAENAMVSVSRPRETHALTLLITDCLANVYQQRALFEIVRSP